METFLNRNFKVKGDISCLFIANEVPEDVVVENIEVQLWHKAPMQTIFLGKGLTDASGEYIIEFEIDSPVGYIVDGKISDVFIRAFYNGEELVLDSLLQGIVAYWKLDEFMGTTAVDATGNSHNATLSGTNIPNWTEGKIDNGVFFNGGTDGSGDSYLSVPSSTDFDFGITDFSFSFWMKSNNLTGGFFLIDTGYGLTDHLMLEVVVPGSWNLWINGLLFYTWTFSIATDTWYHVVISRIRGKANLYLNNEPLGEITLTDVVDNPASEIIFGKYTAGSETFFGVLDEIGIWKGHGLTNEEIARLYNNGNGLQYPF